ncbi:MAG: hypothetical protein DRP01_06575 [Archaeoglobales archaeon]|nr:MAG: hypothetical protein DRP01_06575 [Archaeoglobales archaeon]
MRYVRGYYSNKIRWEAEEIRWRLRECQDDIFLYNYKLYNREKDFIQLRVDMNWTLFLNLL